MSARPDIAAYSPEKKLVLVVEVKNRRSASPEWAAQMRRNLVAGSVVPSSQYFLLALPDVFYLWQTAPGRQPDALPDYSIDPAPLLAPYVDQTQVSIGDISEQGLELLTSAWLQDLMSADMSKERTNPALSWLFDSGLFDAIKNGSIIMDAAA
jgi:hypothetical protein